jgi:hypothetical protein
LSELKEENEELKRLNEIKAYETGNQAMKAVMQEAWGSLVDRQEFLKDTPNFFFEGSTTLSMPHNRKDGDFYPHFRTEQELQRIRGRAEWLAYHHPIAVGLLDDLANYTISTGYKYKLAHKEQSALDDESVFVAQKIIEEFIERTNDSSSECSFEREIFKRSRIAGEDYILVEEPDDLLPGQSEIRLCEPAWITEPKNAAALKTSIPLEGPVNWKYGIATPKHRSDKTRGYFCMWNGEPDQWKVHLAEEMVHLKINVPSTIKRGLSDFYGVESHLEDQEKLLRNTARGAALQAAIAMIREHQPGMRGSDVERIVAGKADTTIYGPSVPGGNVKQRKLRAYESGTVLDVVGSKYYPGPLGAPHGPTYVEIGQAIIRVVGSRWSMPEHMISNAISGAGGARAALLEMGTPFARATQNRQIIYSKYFKRIIWRVLQIASFRGLIPVPFEVLKESLDLKVDIPEATQRNEAEQHLTLAGRNQAQILSKRTWSEMVNIDFDAEQERILDEMETLPQIDPATGQPVLPGDNLGAEANKQVENPNNKDKTRTGSIGGGGDSSLGFNQDRSLGTRNAKQSIKQKLAAGRAGKEVKPI